MKYKYILGIDPSGNGTSGFCLLEVSPIKTRIINLSEVCLNSFNDLVAYWNAHLEKIKLFDRACKGKLVIAVEDFLLNPKKAKQLAGSRMETSKLIGIIQLYCCTALEIPVIMIKPMDHLSRFTDSVLCDLEIINKTKRGYNTPDGISLSNHTKDALRIAVFYNKLFNIEGENQ